ncbi:hypothetical protein Y032_0473g2110 [Ancylostoma ceylanicum]|uniref:Endonuclease/exonuclease/phosphatase domain-containing protein n=1 Tax=Ancylostoma ceylanicum TaxID=53326 RepID=A0A016WWB0_9BILA|nr:hypothetical protein Y032_0473g2110 [Ancylostoma ceylanicum]
MCVCVCVCACVCVYVCVCVHDNQPSKTENTYTIVFSASVMHGKVANFNFYLKFQVYDITAVNTLNISYVSSKDHSKWGVSMEEKKPVVCIGDINRQVRRISIQSFLLALNPCIEVFKESQNKRGGGAVCIENKKLWKTFYCSVAEYENCKNTAVPHQCKI